MNAGKFKTTEELNHEIKAATDIQDYLISNKQNILTCSLPEHLNMLLTQKGLSKADVIRDCLLDRVYVYQIFAGRKAPSRDKLIALAFGLHLSVEETQKMLKISGNGELYARIERDALIRFALHRKMTIFEVNELLLEHGFMLLGTVKE